MSGIDDPRMDIPGNKHALEELRRLLEGGQAIAFVGAGASAGLYLLWNDLIQRLADEAVARGVASAADRQFWLDSVRDRPQQAVRGIKDTLGDGILGEILRDVFRPKAGTDGNRYTPIHGALIRRRFRGYVTTNYDPGLLEARMALRPDSLATGFGTWKDEFVYRWLTGEIFDEQPCPILFAHGIYERGDTIVLGVAEYREAYRPGAYRRLFDKLWGQERLVFVGFSFADPWPTFVADEIITQTAATTRGAPRHIALIGLPEDQPYSPQMRDRFRDQYNAAVVFYRVTRSVDGSEHHDGLLNTLLSLAETDSTPSPRRSPTVPLPQAQPMVPQRWVHETTNDERYVGRLDTLRRLDRWADDAAVSVVAITGFGGLGKTSLIGRWLRVAGGAARRPVRGIFFWSFYADRNATSFLEALRDFAVNNLSFRNAAENETLADWAIALLKTTPLLLVLDGLEVLQEQPGAIAYGALLEDDLRQLLGAACVTRMPGLVVLTSRFPFADLTPHLGAGLRSLDLDSLTPAEGAELLARCEVAGKPEDREAISRDLEGHPLGLRVFAAALATQHGRDPAGLRHRIFTSANLRQEDPLWRKLGHLLTFYEQQLPPVRATLLSVVSLFRTPVDAATIGHLARKRHSARTAFDQLTDDALHRELRVLGNEHLLVVNRGDHGDVYSCHPVLQDHFRKGLLGRDQTVGAEVAGLLTQRPAGVITAVNEIEPLLGVIELLVEAGDFVRADELYQQRLEDGRIFQRLPAIHEGLRCASGFVGTDAAKRRCEQELTVRRLAFYLNEAGLFASLIGDVPTARRFLDEAIAYGRAAEDRLNLSVNLVNAVGLDIHCGVLTEAAVKAREALDLTLGLDNKTQSCINWAWLAAVLDRSGRVAEAMEAFERANRIRAEIERGRELSSLGGVQWAHLLVRLALAPRARELTRRNLVLSERSNWSDDVARCRWLLGSCDIAESRLSGAADHFAVAESIMRRGRMIRELPQLLAARADLERRLGQWAEAIATCDEALSLAAPRGLRLAQADALALRGGVRFERSHHDGTLTVEQKRAVLERARDDADAALTVARQCGYAWAERDAMALLAEVALALGDEAGALNFRREAAVLFARLRWDGAPP